MDQAVAASHLRHIDLNDPRVLREVLHERSAVAKGVARYRASLEKLQENGSTVLVELAETEPGQRIAEAAVAALVPLVERAQREAVEGLGAKAPGAPMRWWPLILCLGAEKIAYITVRSVLSFRGPDGYRSMRGLSLEVAQHIRTEREFELWCEREAKADAEARAGGSTRLNWAKLTKRLAPELTERAFRKWSKRSDLVVRLQWSTSDRAVLGATLVGLLVTACPDVFRFGQRNASTRGVYRTENVVELTDHAREWLDARHGDNELARPWLMPMIEPPRDWVRVQEPTGGA